MKSVSYERQVFDTIVSIMRELPSRVLYPGERWRFSSISWVVSEGDYVDEETIASRKTVVSSGPDQSFLVRKPSPKPSP
jgi:hypothetical protein